MYTNSISQSNKALIVIAVDQSGSMSGEVTIGSRTTSKADMVTEIANDLIAELVERSRRYDGVRDYFDVAIIGYSGLGVRSLFGDKKWISTSELDKAYIDEREVVRECRMPDGNPQLLQYKTRRWLAPSSTGATPMYEALFTINDIVEEWCSLEENRDSIAPEIFNITDGESTDCNYDDVVEISSKIKGQSTKIGNSLLFNIHISSTITEPQIFPSLESLSKRTNCSRAMLSLYHSASELPQSLKDALIKRSETSQSEIRKAMCFNCAATELITVLNIGSRLIRLA